MNIPAPRKPSHRPEFDSLELRLLLSVAFAPPEVYAAGSGPHSMVTADFNGDGKPDLAVVDPVSDMVSVLRNNGDGTFAPKVDFATGNCPQSVTSADFNGDGHPDLAIANEDSSTVSVLLGNGNGTFATAVDYPTGSYSFSVASADFNGDGKPDLAVTKSGNLLMVLRNNGNGTFAAYGDYATGSVPVSVTPADFNGDGEADLAVANYYSSVSVLFDKGDGAFATAVNYPTGGYSYSLTSADFNGDGKADLAVANFTGGTVGVLLSNGDGTFAPKVGYAAGAAPYSVTSADFNGDGKPDLAVTNHSDNTVSILLGNGNGTFAAKVDFVTGVHPQSVTAADFNGDGEPDLAVANYESDTVWVLLNKSEISSLAVSDTSGSATDESVAFAKNTVGQATQPQTFTLTNNGGQDLNISNFAKGGANGVDFTMGVKDDQGNTVSGTSFSIAPGKAYTVAVTLAPTTPGAKTADITFNTNDPGNAGVIFTMSGNATSLIVTTSPGALSYAEGDGAVAVDPGVTLSDAGGDTLAGATVTILGNYVKGQDFLGFTDQNGITGHWDPAPRSGNMVFYAGVLTLSGTASLEDYQAALQSVTYLNGSADPITAARTISFVADDGISPSFAATRTVAVTAVNNAPVVTASADSILYVENSTPIAADPGITLSDVDSVNLAGATVTISDNYALNVDLLGFTNQNGITGSWNAATGVLTLTGSAEVYLYQAALRSVTYSDSLPNVVAPARTVSFVVDDGSSVNNLSAPATRNISPIYHYVDLAAQFGAGMVLPQDLLSGNGRRFHVPVLVQNLGNVALPAGQKIDIEIDVYDGATTTPIKTLTGMSVSRLRPGGSEKFMTYVTIPPGLAVGWYNLVAVVDSSDHVAEPNKTNNRARSSDMISVTTRGFVELEGACGPRWALSPSVVAGKPLEGCVSVVVTNYGNVASPAGQRVNLHLEASNSGLDVQYTLATLNNLWVGSLAPGRSRLFYVRVNDPLGLPAGSYDEGLIFDGSVPVSQPEDTITATPPFVDLIGGFRPMTLPICLTSGDGRLITVPVMVTNIGNVPLAAGQKIDIQIDAFDGATTMPLKTLTARSVSSLGAGKSTTFPTTVTLPIGLTTGTYNIVAKMDSTGAVTGDTNRGNNTATSDDTIAVAHGLVDLSAGKFGASTLHTSLAAGAPLTGTVSVTMKNTGTVAMPTGQGVTIKLVAHNTVTSVDVPLGTLDGTLTAALAVNRTKSFTVSVNLPTGLTAGTYDIEETITPDSNLADFTAGLYTVLLNALGKTLMITAS